MDAGGGFFGDALAVFGDLVPAFWVGFVALGEEL
jgi:hypothetical protein